MKKKPPMIGFLRHKLKIKTIDQVKAEAITNALAKTKDDVILAAALLGIGKTTIYRFLEGQ
jgi:transcriptional regulator of acetoin/glycerol metabolism